MATKLRRTLFIGLGGTGMNALLHAKKTLYDTYGEIPPMIGFLGIDTDGGVYNKKITAKDGTDISLNVAEQLAICVNSPAKIYEHSPNDYSWLPKCNAGSLTALNIGAGQVRSNGRFAITINEEEVQNRVQRKLQDINSASIIDNPKYALMADDTEIHMVFSLSGGTGCGSFLNMAYLLKRIAPNVKISGYAVLADIFRAMMQGPQVVRVRPNAYGAIADLDFLMHLDPTSEPIEIQWLKDIQKVNERPFTALYLIDKKNSNNDTFDNIDQLCEMISLALITSTGELSVATSSVSDNVAKVIADGSMDILNKKAWVAGFGVSEIVLNNRALAKTYADKAALQLIDKMRNGGCDDPIKLATDWIDNNKIRENLGKDDVIDYFMSPEPNRSFTDIDDMENPKPECEDFIANRAMPTNNDLDEKLSMLKERIEVSLVSFITSILDRECGVFTAENCINAIKRQIELCNGEMKTEINDLNKDLPAVESTLQTRIKELEDCMSTFFRKGKKGFADDVCQATMAVCRMKREIKRRQYASQFYNWLTTRINESYSRIDIIQNNLKAVYKDASTDQEKIRHNLSNGSFFQFELATETINQVTCPISDIIFNDFLQTLNHEGGVVSFASMTSVEVHEKIYNFVCGLPTYKKWTGCTIDDTLRDMNGESLRQLLQRAVSKAQPLFTYDYHGYDREIKSRPADSYYVGVADKSSSCLMRDNLLANIIPGQGNLQLAGTGVSDRIIIYRQIGVLPAFTVSALDSYRGEYDRFENDKNYTSHWDANICRRMKEERFDIMPRNIRNEQQILEHWVLALITGLITHDDAAGKYTIKSRALGGRPLNLFKVHIGESRAEAYRFFGENFDILLPEIETNLSAMDIPGPENPLRLRSAEAKKSALDGTYLTTFSQCPIDAAYISSYPQDEDLINKEMEFIIDNL